MKFGICTAPDNLSLVTQQGFDYIEPGVSGVLRPHESEPPELETLEKTFAASTVRAQAFNVLLPGTLRVVGPDRDVAALERYLETACLRASRLGARVLVFGSGGARNVPDGFSRAQAWGEIKEFLGLAGAAAARQNIVIAIEPLNRKECNILNSVEESAQMAREVALPESVGVLSDLFHVFVENQSFEETAQAAREGWLRHVHVACTSDRHAPRKEDRDVLARFFTALKGGGYDKRISIEAGMKDFASDAPIALGVMREEWELATA